MKKLYTILIIILAVLCVGPVVGLIINSQLTPNQTAETYVAVDINPSVEFTVNSDGKVISTLATDADGDEIVQSYNFYGMNIVDACAMFTQLCAEGGYGIDVDAEESTGAENDVVITVVNASETVQNQYREQIKSKIQNYFLNNGIFGKVDEDTLETYFSQLVTDGVLTQEEANLYLTAATTYNLSIGKLKLIMSVLDYNADLTLADLANMNTNEIVALLKTTHQSIGATVSSIRAQLKADIEALKTSETYADMFTLLGTISNLQDQLTNTDLTEEEIADLQSQLDTAKANFDENYTDLFTQYKADKATLIAQAKEDSKTLIDQVKNTYKNKVSSNNQKMQNLKARINSALKQRIQNWLDGLDE